jgi:hypothetical protein
MLSTRSGPISVAKSADSRNNWFHDANGPRKVRNLKLHLELAGGAAEASLAWASSSLGFKHFQQA